MPTPARPPDRATGLTSCAARFGLHAARWNNCANNSSTLDWVPVALSLQQRLQAWYNESASGGLILFLGDSVMRDVFTLAACLLEGVNALDLRPAFMGNPHHGSASQFIFARVRDGRGHRGVGLAGIPHGGPTLAFLWAHRVCERYTAALSCKQARSGNELAATNWTRNLEISLARVYGGDGLTAATSFFGTKPNPFHALAARAGLVLHGGLAFSQGRAEAEAMMMLTHAWLRRHVRPSAVVAVMETMPAHFPQRAFGEYDPHYHPQLPAAGRRCSPHDASLAAARPADGFRRHVATEFAAQHALPLLSTWDLARDAHDDHSLATPQLIGQVDKRLGSFDCRHWCNPGPTMLALVARLAAFIEGHSEKRIQ